MVLLPLFLLPLISSLVRCSETEERPIAAAEDDFAVITKLSIRKGPYKALTTGASARMPSKYYPSCTTRMADDMTSDEELEDYDTCDSDVLDEFDDAILELPLAPLPLIELDKERPSRLLAAFLQVLLGMQFPALAQMVCGQTAYAQVKERCIETFANSTSCNPSVAESALGPLLDQLRMLSIQFDFTNIANYRNCDDSAQVVIEEGLEKLMERCDVEVGQFSANESVEVPRALERSFKRFMRDSGLRESDPTMGVATFFSLLLADPSKMRFRLSSYTYKTNYIKVLRDSEVPVVTLRVRKQLELSALLDSLVQGNYLTHVNVPTLDQTGYEKCNQTIRLKSFPKLQLFHLKRTARNIARQRAGGTTRNNSISHRPVDVPLQLKTPFNSLLRAAICFDSHPDSRHSPQHDTRYSVVYQDVDSQGNYFSLYAGASGRSHTISEEEAMKRVSRFGILLFYQKADDVVLREYRYSVHRPALNYPRTITRRPTEEELNNIGSMDFNDLFPNFDEPSSYGFESSQESEGNSPVGYSLPVQLSTQGVEIRLYSRPPSNTQDAYSIPLNSPESTSPFSPFSASPISPIASSSPNRRAGKRQPSSKKHH